MGQSVGHGCEKLRSPGYFGNCQGRVRELGDVNRVTEYSGITASWALRNLGWVKVSWGLNRITRHTVI